MNRKPIQISTIVSQAGFRSISTLVVLCDDGSILQYAPREKPPWTIFPPIPGQEASLAPVDPLHDLDEPGIRVL